MSSAFRCRPAAQTSLPQSIAIILNTTSEIKLLLPLRVIFIEITSHFHRDVGLGKQGGHGGVPLHSKGILIFGHRILYFYVRAWDLHVHGPCVLSKQTILVGRGEAQGTSIFSTQRSFLTNRAPSISIYKETGLQTFQRCKDT